MKPILQALLVADHVYTDTTTGKKVVAGIFHSLRFKKLPAPDSASEELPKEVTVRVSASGHRAGSPFCYISLTELRGKKQFELRYVDLDENNTLFRATFFLESDDPVQTQEVVLPLPELPLIKTGSFALELLCDDEPLGSHRIVSVEGKGE